MSEHLKLGSLIEAGRTVERDAIHIAVCPVVAGQVLAPGDRVVMRYGKAYAADGANGHGIVDPFLATGNGPDAGDRFWLYLHPGSITSLRHEWEHPALPLLPVADGARAEAEEYMREYVKEFHHPDGYEIAATLPDLLRAIEDGSVCFKSETTSQDAERDRERFMFYAETLIGRRITPADREKVWFCAC